MTSGSSSNQWLNLSGAEPDLYYASAESTLSGSCRTPEEGDPQWGVIPLFSQLAICDPPAEGDRYDDHSPTHAIWAPKGVPAGDGLYVPRKPFSEPMPYRVRADPRLRRSRSQNEPPLDPRESNTLWVPEQPAYGSPRRAQSNSDLPTTSFERFTNGAAGLRPSSSYANGFDSCQTADESMEWKLDQVQARQDEVMAAVRMLRSGLRHVQAEIDDLQSNQSEYSEDVAEAWQVKRCQWLPLN